MEPSRLTLGVKSTSFCYVLLALAFLLLELGMIYIGKEGWCFMAGRSGWGIIGINTWHMKHHICYTSYIKHVVKCHVLHHKIMVLIRCCLACYEPGMLSNLHVLLRLFPL